MPMINWDEIVSCVQLAWPIMLTFLLQTSLNLVGVMFVGQIGTKELAAASLVRSFSKAMLLYPFDQPTCIGNNAGQYHGIFYRNRIF